MPQLNLDILHAVALQHTYGNVPANRYGKSIFALSKALGEIDLEHPVEYHIACLKEATATMHCKQMLWLAQEMGMRVHMVQKRKLLVENTTVFFEFMTERGISHYDYSSDALSPIKEKTDTEKVEEKIQYYHALSFGSWL